VAISAKDKAELDIMVLALSDHHAMLAGFGAAGFVCARAPKTVTNPIEIEWHFDGQQLRYRLWAFDVTHGGGGSSVRAADEFRIQITNGPISKEELDQGGAIDLLIGYSRDRDAIVAYDRRWLERWIDKTSGGERGSPSIQVKDADIQSGHDRGIYHLTKAANFGEADIVTMSPAMLPTYLLNHDAALRGKTIADQAQLSALSIVDHCRKQGFPFEADLVARYLAAVLTKPFVILAGVSGTGKSKLAELVAQFYSPTAISEPAGSSTPERGDAFVFVPASGPPDPTRFALVAVRPDWIDNQAILGFVNPITEEYESTQALDLILRAHRAVDVSPNKAATPRYFMLLDEMNLARVEHYFSDWLACAESRRLRADGEIIQHPVPLHRSNKVMATNLRRPNGSIETVPVPASLELPTNLVVTGTVNIDETTYGFSPKVLDRAMVIEFDEVDLERLRTGGGPASADGYRFPDVLPPFRLATGTDYSKLPVVAHERLVALNKILEEARLHLGYRAANEIALFMAIYNQILPEDPTDGDWRRALDAAVLQKVLPRISGNRAKIENSLARVCAYLRVLEMPASDLSLEEFDDHAQAALPKSYVRAVDMLESLRDFGFVSFFK
jgi:hypothetical protein